MSQFDQQSGFVAGTLVHTDKGLVPIEQLKVGDFVLSKPNSDPNAPNTYKRVTRTFKSDENKRIQLLGVVNSLRNKDWDFWSGNPSKFPAGTISEEFLVARDKFIWIDRVSWASEDLGGTCTEISPDEQVGWQRIDFLHEDMELRLIGGENATCTMAGNTFSLITTDIDGLLYEGFSTTDPRSVWDTRSGVIQEYNVAELMMYEDDERLNFDLFISENNIPQPLVEFGRFYFSRRRALHIYGEELLKKLINDKPNFKLRTSEVKIETVESSKVNPLYANDYVYNIEVEDYHTYFIGKLGLWIHDASANIS
ncbi:MAG: hypothetical protein H7Z73_04385 [Candidatus Saccharibacteria bacterium]|nr:hypothetical protein [Moraxellaceae bacterium]